MGDGANDFVAPRFHRDNIAPFQIGGCLVGKTPDVDHKPPLQDNLLAIAWGLLDPDDLDVDFQFTISLPVKIGFISSSIVSIHYTCLFVKDVSLSS